MRALLVLGLFGSLVGCVKSTAVQQFSAQYQCAAADSREMDDLDFYEVTGCGRRSVYFCSDNGYASTCTERESVAFADTSGGDVATP